MAHTARMREIVPGLFLGNVEASYNRDMLAENRINAVVSLTDARWALWTCRTRQWAPEHRHKWVQCVDSSTQDLLVHMSDICDFIDQMASPALQSSYTLPVKHEHGFSDKPCSARSEATYIDPLYYGNITFPKYYHHCIVCISCANTAPSERTFWHSFNRSRKLSQALILLDNFKFGRRWDIKCGRMRRGHSRKRRTAHF